MSSSLLVNEIPLLTCLYHRPANHPDSKVTVSNVKVGIKIKKWNMSIMALLNYWRIRIQFSFEGKIVYFRNTLFSFFFYGFYYLKKTTKNSTFPVVHAMNLALYSHFLVDRCYSFIFTTFSLCWNIIIKSSFIKKYEILLSFS